MIDFVIRYFRATWLGAVTPLQSAYANRHLLTLLIKRDVKVRTSGTALGDAWLLFQPALQILGFWFLLDVVLKIKLPNNVVFVDYFLIGMLPWLFIAEILTRSLGILSEFGSLYRRSIFPIEILPILPLFLSAALYALVMGVTVGLLEGIHAVPMGLLSILLIAIWLMPFCYLLSIIGLFLKDVAQIFPFLITVTLYVTPILYMRSSMPEPMQWVLMLNPIADIIALIHGAIQSLDWDMSNIVRPVILWLCLIGPVWVIFRRAEPHVREML